MCALARGGPVSTSSRPVAIFVPSVRGGGAERAMLMFARELVTSGFPVDLVTTSFEGTLGETVPKGVRVVDLKSAKTIYALPRLVRYLRKRKPRALFSTIMNANIVAVWAARFSGVNMPVIVRESNAPVSTPKLSLSHRVIFRLAPYTYAHSNGVIAVSHGVAEELGIMAPSIRNKVHVVPTPVISDDVIRQGAMPVDHPWLVTKDKPVILSAARLQKHKGFLTLLHAFKKLRERVDARLLVIGEGAYRSRIEKEIQDLQLSEHVSLHGFQTNPFAFMSRADAFVLASEFEGLPNVLVQAMAFGTPVVATDCRSGPSEILCGGRFGKLVPVGDVDALAAALEQALNEPRQHAAQEHARRVYSAQSAAAAYRSLAGLH